MAQQLSFSAFIKNTEEINICNLIDAVPHCDYSRADVQLALYPSRDALHLFSHPVDDFAYSIEQFILLACCWGMGIGTPLNYRKALEYCVEAGKAGNRAAILTSIALFGRIERDDDPRDIVEMTVFPSSSLFGLWRLEDWKREGNDPCDLALPQVFFETPAARKLAQVYPAIRQRLAISCACTTQGPGKHGSNRQCGWTILKSLCSNLERKSQGTWNTKVDPVDRSQLIAEAMSFTDGEHTILDFAAASLFCDEKILVEMIDIILCAGLRKEYSIGTTVHWAIRAGNETVALHLLKMWPLKEIDVARECREAILTGAWDILRTILERIQNNPNAESQVSLEKLLMILCSVPHFHNQVCATVATRGMAISTEFGRDEKNTTLLIAAIRSWNSDLAKYILDAINIRDSQYIDIVDLDGETALSEAIKHGNKTILAALLRVNVRLEWQFGGHKLSALLVASQTLSYLRSSVLFAILLGLAPTAVDSADERGNTIFHYLAFGVQGLDTRRAMDCVLKSSGSPATLVNRKNNEAQTPLHFAVFGGILANVRYLLAKGAHISDADVRRYTVVHIATDDIDNNYEILAELTSRCNKQTLDAQDQWGRTALMHAAGKLVPGNDSEKKDLNGNDAGRALSMLCVAGASVTLCDNYGQNMLHHYQGRRAEVEFQSYTHPGKTLIYHPER